MGPHCGRGAKKWISKIVIFKVWKLFFQITFTVFFDIIGGQTLDRNIFWEINFNAWPPISWIFKRVLFNLLYMNTERTCLHGCMSTLLIKSSRYYPIWLILYDSLLTQKRMICENVWYNICTCITSDNIKNTIWTNPNVLLI